MSDVRCPVCGGSDIKRLIGDWYVCRDCLSEFTYDGARYDDIKEHRSASEKYARQVFDEYVDAITIKDVDMLRNVKTKVERLKNRLHKKYFDYDGVLKDIDKELNELFKGNEGVGKE